MLDSPPKEQKFADCSKLAHRVWELLYTTDIPLIKVAADCDVSYSWLMRFKGMAFHDIPSVDRMERLYEYLTGKTLEF